MASLICSLCLSVAAHTDLFLRYILLVSGTLSDQETPLVGQPSFKSRVALSGNSQCSLLLFLSVSVSVVTESLKHCMEGILQPWNSDWTLSQ